MFREIIKAESFFFYYYHDSFQNIKFNNIFSKIYLFPRRMFFFVFCIINFPFIINSPLKVFPDFKKVRNHCSKEISRITDLEQFYEHCHSEIQPHFSHTFSSDSQIDNASLCIGVFLFQVDFWATSPCRTSNTRPNGDSKSSTRVTWKSWKSTGTKS